MIAALNRYLFLVMDDEKSDQAIATDCTAADLIQLLLVECDHRL